MRQSNKLALAILLPVLLLAVSVSMAEEEETTGQVRLPLDTYTNLIDTVRDPIHRPRPAPTSYALGNARVTVQVAGEESRATGTIQVQLGIDVLEDEWMQIQVLPPGTPVDSVTVDGKAVQLVATATGLAWSTNKSGSYTMSLSYKVDAARADAGFSLPVPLPQAAAMQLTAVLPGTGLDATVIPGAGTQVVASGGNTRVTATVPTTNGVQIAWRVPSKLGHAISRAVYEGRLADEAVIWTGELVVELFGDESTVLPLLPSHVTLSALQVDGKDATILVENGKFATLIKGRGLHAVTVGLQVPVIREEGPPRIDLQIPRTPVSRFDLTIPGKVELSAQPSTSISNRTREGATVATVHVPMTHQVSFSWSEAVPDEIKAEVRSNATIYHAVHADEGVLYVHALLQYEVSRGETNRIELLLPAGVQINQIDAASGAVADWRVGAPAKDGTRVATIFLDRQLRGPLRVDVFYDRSLGTETDREAIDVPLIWAARAQRQRGMVALLSNTELTLNPVEETRAVRVGENQLPGFVRDAVTMTVAHTYKYTETLPGLVVAASVPDPVQGKFDAQIDTLISLGDVTLTGSASVALNVKSGRIMALQLELPADVNLLNLVAPSLRVHKVTPAGATQLVDVEFTQEMEGQFRLDLTYERILADGDAEAPVPTVRVPGAEVTQGRIAVEALTAVEVQAASAIQLSALDVNELPRQLVLRTTNPILLAYKYVDADPPPALTLDVTRHELIGVQEAAIESAAYRTLFTRDGLLVTTASFTVRNSRKQFLRVQLPEDSEIWSAFVNGKPEKPALGSADEDGRRSVLIKIIHSTEGFPVELIYATRGRRIGRLGSIEGQLPRPDILVTRSHWDVFLPDGFGYGEPSTNMDPSQPGTRVSREQMASAFSDLEKREQAQPAGPLRITVPHSGVHFVFEKLYANQADRDSRFRIPYASAGGRVIGRGISFIGLAFLWLGIGLGLRTRRFAAATVLGLVGLAILIVSTRIYHVDATLPLVISVLIAVLLAAFHGRGYLDGWRRQQTVDGA